MKFELAPYHRNTPDNELLNDLKEVAKFLNKSTVTVEEYEKHGKFNRTTLSNRFGSWLKALKSAGLETKRSNKKLTIDEIIDDIKSVANKLNKETITSFEYDSHGKFSSSAISHNFQGSWLKALNAAGLKKSRNFGITNEEYFENIEMVWRLLGRQPKYQEMVKPLSKYSNGAYERRFGTWRNALSKFVESINDSEIIESDKKTNEIIINSISVQENVISRHKTKREVNYRLRFLVLRRDNFKCKVCGRSPATDPEIILHVDHIIPWDKGGESVFDNLQSLCSDCNLGKSNLDFKLS
jgi:5-methylcytosine-specific restriction endonuclease McrA